MEHIVVNFKILLKFNWDNTLPSYPPPNTYFAWNHNSQQLHLIPPCSNFMLLYEVDDALSLSPQPISTHPTKSWTSYPCKLVAFASIHPFCSQNLSHSFSKNLFFLQTNPTWKINQLFNPLINDQNTYIKWSTFVVMTYEYIKYVSMQSIQM